MRHLFRLTPSLVGHESLCCLGYQLANLVAHLDREVGEVHWYMFDINTENNDSRFNATSNATISTKDFIQMVASVSQFLSGVFVAVPLSVEKPVFREPIKTDDAVDVPISPGILEVRAFDTSYFEVLTDDPTISSSISKSYSCPPTIT